MTISLPSLQCLPDGRLRWLVEGKPFRLIGGEVHNSASSSLPHLARVFARATELRCNALAVPVTWELCEPREGVFDWSLVDGMLALARQFDMRIVPLWFGTYKNAMSSYAPGWVKTDQQRFPRAEITPGRRIGAISVLSAEARRSDAQAFAAFMSHLAAVDGIERRVAMVQVENEVGLLGASRDRSPEAEHAFAEPVPESLSAYLTQHRHELRPELAEAWTGRGANWSEAFGAIADEAFMAWNFASFTGAVAAAGRRQHDLPCYANAWLVQYPGETPGRYPSGGPVSRMRDLWRAAAPAIDLLAPDIYLQDFTGVCIDYASAGNPLFIPEARRDQHAAARAWFAFGQHDALAYAPFGIENVGLAKELPIDGVVANGTTNCVSTPEAAHALAESFRLLRDLLPAIDPWLGTPRCAGMLQTSDTGVEYVMGGYRIHVRWTEPFHPNRVAGGGLIVSPIDGEFIVAGLNLCLDFAPVAAGFSDFIEIWDGDYHDGAWAPGCRLNGDEYAVRLGPVPGVRRCRLYIFH